MTVKHKGNQEYEGLSTDTKPLAADTAVNATFAEIDTGNQYRNNGTTWLAYGGGAGSDPDAVETLSNKTINAETNTLPFVQPTVSFSIYFSGTTAVARNNKTGAITTNTSGEIDGLLTTIIAAISPAGTPTVIEIGEGNFKIANTLAAISSGRIGNITIKGQGIGVTNLIGQTSLTGATTILWDVKGAVSGTGRNLTANATRGSLTLTVSTGDAAAFAAGDYVLLRSTSDYSTAISKRGQQGEIHRIRARNTGTGVITMDHQIYDNYNTADSANIIKLAMLRNITIKDLTIKTASGYTAENALLRCHYVDNLKIEKVEIMDSVGNYNSGLYLLSCINFDVDTVVTQNPANTYNLQYGVVCESACQNGRIFVQGKGKLRHTFTTGGRNGADTAGAVRNITISGTSENTAAGHFDTHADSDGIIFTNCNAMGYGDDPADTLDTTPTKPAVNIRSKNTIITNCNFINSVGKAISIGEDSWHTVIQGCQFRKMLKTSGGLQGHAIELDVGIKGTVIAGNSFSSMPATSNTIAMLGGNDDTTIAGNAFIACGPIDSVNSSDCVVTGNRFENGAQKAINMSGTSNNWVISGNNAIGSAASTFTGAGTVKTGNINLT